MILGIGADLIDIRRIQHSMDRFGDRFLARVFTEGERARAQARARPAASFAKRFAAKEACAKALGTGLNGAVFWQDMEVRNGPSGAPNLHLTRGAAQRLAMLTPAGYHPRIHLTLTDDYPLAQAFVMISAESQRESHLITFTQGVP